MDDNKKNRGSDNSYFHIIPTDILTLFGRNPLSEFLTVTSIGLFPKAKYHACMRNEGIDEAILTYCSEGTGFYNINNCEDRIIKPKQMFILPPGVPHHYASSYNMPWTIFWMHVKGRFFDTFYNNWRPGSAGYAPNCKSSPPELINISDAAAERIKEIFFQCFSILKMPYQWEEFFYICQLAATVISLIPGASKHSSSHLTETGNRGIETAISYMTSHLHENITLEELANAACYSISHLHHLFREFSGYAPIEYFLRMKIQAAAEPIILSNSPIRKISETYGINDPYYFSRLFKKVMGLSPLQYRKANQMYLPNAK